MPKSSLIITSVIICCALTACGPIPVETEPHQVSVNATQEPAGKHMDSARFRAAGEDVFIQAVLEEITKTNNKTGIVPGREFMTAVFPGKQSATIKELASEMAIDRIRELPVTHIILIEHRSSGDVTHGKVTAAATLINTEQLYQIETISFDAEGHRVGISLPLPYIFLFFPYSDPDVFGSATDKVADALTDKLIEDSRSHLSLTILASDNLAELISSSHEQQAKPDASPSSTNVIKKWKNPFGFYSDIMSKAREEGEWMYFNPLAHIQMLFTGVIMAPTMVAVDAIVSVDAMLDDDTNVSSTDNLTPLNTEENQKKHMMDKNELYVDLKRRAESGDADAQYDVYLFMRDEHIDPVVAWKWLCKSADQGYKKARIEVGFWYKESSWGYAQASRKEWMRKAGIQTDNQVAYMWYTLAANGDVDRLRTINNLFSGKLTEEEIAQANDMVRNWKPGQCPTPFQ